MSKKRPRPKIDKINQSDRSKRSIASHVYLQPRPLRLLLALALFLAIAGARWWLVGKYGGDVPYMDQWNAEAWNIYKP